MKKQNEIILLLTSILIMSLFWIGFNLYHNAKTSTINASLEEAIMPISPNFASSVITQLKNRHYIAPEYSIERASPSAIPSQQPVVSQTPL